MTAFNSVFVFLCTIDWCPICSSVQRVRQCNLLRCVQLCVMYIGCDVEMSVAVNGSSAQGSQPTRHSFWGVIEYFDNALPRYVWGLQGRAVVPRDGLTVFSLTAKTERNSYKGRRRPAPTSERGNPKPANESVQRMTVWWVRGTREGQGGAHAPV